MDTRGDIGRIVWHDLMTNDLAGAMRFYAELFGWEYRIEHAAECAWTGEEADYPLILCNGQAHGGFVNPGRTLLPFWLAYVRVADVAATVATPRSVGATISGQAGTREGLPPYRVMLALSQLDVAAVARRFRQATAVRAIGGLLTFIGIGLASVWIAMWAAYVFAGRLTPVDREAFKIVAALDLALMVPALTAGGVLIWSRRPWGYVTASLASIQGALYLLVLSVNSIIAIRRGLASAPGELPVWGTLFVVTTGIAFVLLASVQRERDLSS